MDTILGVIMAGGFSSRMGQDKALLSIEGKTWIQKQYDLLSFFFDRTLLSIRRNQDYRLQLPEVLHIPDEEIAEGPLRGILSVHKQFPSSHLFIAAVDLPYLDQNTIAKLLAQFHKNPEAEVVVFKQNFYEPLCAIYSAGFLSGINSRLTTLHQFSLQSVIESARKKIVLEITEEDVQRLKNVNTPEV